MAIQVPIHQQQVGNAPLPGYRQNIQDQASQGLAELGTGISRLAEGTQKVIDEHNTAVVQDKYAKLVQAKIDLLHDPQNGILAQQGENAIKGAEPKRVRPKSARGISAERVARAVLHGYFKNKREVIVPWTMIPVVKLYQLFPGTVERAMTMMARNTSP